MKIYKATASFVAMFTIWLVGSGKVYGDPAPLIPLYPDHVRDHVERALDTLGMTSSDAGFEKDHGKPLWTLGWITNTLNDPWQLPGHADALYTAAESDNPEKWWSIGAELMELDVGLARASGEPHDKPFAGWDSLVNRFLVYVEEIDEMLEASFGNLSLEDRIYLSASILASTFESADNEVHRNVLLEAGISEEALDRIEEEARQLDGSDASLRWLDLVNQVDLPGLYRSFHLFYHAVLNIRNEVTAIEEWPDSPLIRESHWGHIIIGTMGDDAYEGPALLIIDPGGSDTYRNGVGAANGLEGRRMAAIIDLGGDDVFHEEGLLGAGSALWGLAVVLNTSGDDRYESAFVGAGAALFGGAWLEDFSGSDQYRGHAIGQGAGMVGFGFLIDHAGDDVYDVGFYGQGFAGVKGWGMLLDRAGNDRYLAGNRRLDHERNDERYLSLSQGFSIGMRPHAGGGVASLIDLSGNDIYIGDIYAQGVSYYYSAGFLLDGGGHDRYSMYQYGQGCGIHMSLGLLADAWGNDSYSGYILAQGAAHDYSVGMLFDHQGDDTYTADHHAQGRALNNAFALLVDRTGNDAYFSRQRDGAQGIGNNGGFRDYGSLALLIDLAGADIYSGGFSNSMITLRPLYGVVYDYKEDTGHE
ncbi:MAG TPA: hypothetical protein PJ991_01805 [Kiritimatiellia bacterium]|nr:hypothetical protein [Kiritimatiellia bacterium]